MPFWTDDRGGGFGFANLLPDSRVCACVCVSWLKVSRNTVTHLTGCFIFISGFMKLKIFSEGAFPITDTPDTTHEELSAARIGRVPNESTDWTVRRLAPPPDHTRSLIGVVRCSLAVLTPSRHDAHSSTCESLSLYYLPRCTVSIPPRRSLFTSRKHLFITFSSHTGYFILFNCIESCCISVSVRISTKITTWARAGGGGGTSCVVNSDPPNFTHFLISVCAATCSNTKPHAWRVVFNSFIWVWNDGPPLPPRRGSELPGSPAPSFTSHISNLL